MKSSKDWEDILKRLDVDNSDDSDEESSKLSKVCANGASILNILRDSVPQLREQMELKLGEDRLPAPRTHVPNITQSASDTRDSGGGAHRESASLVPQPVAIHREKEAQEQRGKVEHMKNSSSVG